MGNGKKIGLVLSGGGVKGVAHIGVLKALAEANIHPQLLSGSSAGALVGALYASGRTPDEILAIFKESSIFTLSNFAFGKPGIIDLSKFKKQFQRYFDTDSFESLQKTLFVAATDLVRGRNKIFQSGPVVDAILASSAFPLMFSPYDIKGTLYADGGIVNNFPVEPLLDKCDFIIGVYVNPLQKIEPSKLTNTYRVSERVYQIATRYSSLLKLERCHYVLMPQVLEQYGTFDMKKANTIYNIGYEEALKAMPEITSALEALTGE
ncbi:MAG: patatin [Flavobacteriaceae bacterium]|nr:patatin [Flavobacteriaceae bacterium]